ncbi:TOG array regulator of axonemal microtubules protein 1-like [Clupea harengus]|uniref:TOG array regulator of axonemal microtubules protein 1-like n=1 Tax=Clupea harengus TaxID=7950 RepID=A0A6P8EN58_CLUHA|nr:TOG array regulator of axonemal microtubules protein 1-like [Clupea harengus]
MFDDMFPSPSLQSQHQLLHLHPHLLPVPPPDRNPMMPCSTLVRRVKKAFMASVASGQQEVLPPIFTNQATGVGQKEAEKIKASRTPSERQTLPLLRTPPFPTAPAVPTPPQTINCGQFRSRLPRLKKTASLSIAAAVEEQKSVEALSGRNKGARELKEVKMKVRGKRQARQSQKVKELPELAKLPPLPCPEQALLQAFRLLSVDDWEKKIEGLTSIRSLSQHHAELLLPRLHDLCLAVTEEVKNLRSMVSRTAIRHHPGALLQKAGEASGFIRDDVELALGYMVVNVTPSRSMNALINTGVRHRNTAARKSTAQHLGRLAEVMGSSHLLSGKNKLTDRFIHAISCLAVDCALEVRTHAHNTLAFLASHPNLIKMVERFVPQRDHITIKDIINKGQCRNLN